MLYSLDVIKHHDSTKGVKMANIQLLKDTIKDSGMTFTAISDKTGILRATLYNRLNGVGEFTGPEITALAEVLHMTNKERDNIFLSDSVINKHA